MLRLGALCWLSLWFQAAPAAIYYVDCSATVNGAGTSYTVPFNGAPALSTSLNWGTIMAAPPYGVYFRAGTTCTTGQVLASGANSFPDTVNVNGTVANHLIIGVYDPANGALIAIPARAQYATLAFDGVTRGGVMELFGFTWTDVIGFNLSGGTNSSGRGAIMFGANGATVAANDSGQYLDLSQGATPANTAMLGAVASGTASGATTSDITFDHLTVHDLRGAASATAVQCSNTNRCNLTNSVISAARAGTSTIGLLVQSTVEARDTTAGSTVTGNTFQSNQYGIRYAPSGAVTGFASITAPNWSSNTFNAQTLEGIYAASPLTTAIIDGNTFISPGSGTGAGAGIFLSAPTSGLVGSTNAINSVMTNNVITDAGQFGIWITGLHGLAVNNNTISRCGTPSLTNTFGRCIEVADVGTTTRPAQTLTLSATAGAAITVTAGGATFAATDLDKLIAGPPDNDGACRITAFTSTTVVTCNVLRPFLSVNVAVSVWYLGWIAHDIQANFNTITTAYGQQYTASPGTEGVGIGFDNYTSVSTAMGNWISNTDFGAIALNAGVGNKLIGNVIVAGGRDPTALMAAASVRHTGLQLYYTGTQVWNNSINCKGNQYGITAENSTTSNPSIPAHGGISEYRNNLLLNCAGAGIVGNANDLASNNAYFNNAVNYTWMAQLSFSSVPLPGNLTPQTLDGASVITDPKLIQGTPLIVGDFKLQAGSPLVKAGLTVGPYHDARQCPFWAPPSIGALENCAGDPGTATGAATSSGTATSSGAGGSGVAP